MLDVFVGGGYCQCYNNGYCQCYNNGYCQCDNETFRSYIFEMVNKKTHEIIFYFVVDYDCHYVMNDP